MFLGLSGGQPIYVFDRPTRLLVVDDDPIMREFALAHLTMPGGTLLTAEDGEEAWEILEREPHPFDIVLSDLEMPRLTGFGLLDRMRADRRFAHLPVVVITSREDMFAIDRAFETGATSFVTKPVNWRLLGHQLRYVMKSSRIEAQVREGREAAEQGVALRNDLLRLIRHESQESLHVILGFTDLLEAGLTGEEIFLEHAGRVREAAARLHERLDRVFGYSQLVTGAVAMDREKVLARHLVGEVTRSLAPEAERVGTKLTAEFEGSRDAAVAGDLRLLSRALEEVIRNAIAHPRTNAPITVRARDEGSGPITIVVEDEGSGMSASALEACRRVLPPEDAAGRRGLGIPMVRRIVELNGGEFAISSHEGVGTSVTISLPRVT